MSDVPAPKPTVQTSDTQVTVARAKGRPMLSWVGKKPLGRVIAYPAQRVERFATPPRSIRASFGRGELV